MKGKRHATLQFLHAPSQTCSPYGIGQGVELLQHKVELGALPLQSREGAEGGEGEMLMLRVPHAWHLAAFDLQWRSMLGFIAGSIQCGTRNFECSISFELSLVP